MSQLQLRPSASYSPPSVSAAALLSLPSLQGRLCEVSSCGAEAGVSLAMQWVLEAQLCGEHAAWVQRVGSSFFPPDVAECGIDLAALPVIFVQSSTQAARAAEQLLRSSGFTLVVIDECLKKHDWQIAMQSRLLGLAQKHHSATVFLNTKKPTDPSLGSLVSLHLDVQRQPQHQNGERDRFSLQITVHKDKRGGAGVPPGTKLYRTFRASRGGAVIQTACLHVFELALQLTKQQLMKQRVMKPQLMKQRLTTPDKLSQPPDWHQQAAVVVDEDKPQGLILWANEAARRKRISRGMRFSAGLSLDANLYASVISEAEQRSAEAEIVKVLHQFSPGVQRVDTGLFLLDIARLGLVFSSPKQWAEKLQAALKDLAFEASLTLGYTPFLCVVLAKSRSFASLQVLRNTTEESVLSHQVELHRLSLFQRPEDAAKEQKSLALLHKLGVDKVGELLRLPGPELARRMGPSLGRLHALCSKQQQAPIAHEKEQQDICCTLHLEEGENDAERLTFLLKQLCHGLLTRAQRQVLVLEKLYIDLTLERHGKLNLEIHPAQPTLDVTLLTDLIRLKLSTTELPSAVRQIELLMQTLPANTEQLRLQLEQQQRNRRDVQAADRALARLRAEFGENAVRRANLKNAHLPEAQFEWQAMQALPSPTPVRTVVQQIVRRLLSQAMPLPSSSLSRSLSRSLLRSSDKEPDGWLVAGLELGAVRRQLGPYVVSGAWWHREIQREYYFLEVNRGDFLWVYFDHRQKRWLQLGVLA